MLREALRVWVRLILGEDRTVLALVLVVELGRLRFRRSTGGSRRRLFRLG
jgi:hypothetical protein